ncbi:MAG: hypothetical protein NT128_03100 [Proteobacteria bacterium]|nr:hypothetical protein [Pseudomonadota bacterium]
MNNNRNIVQLLKLFAVAATLSTSLSAAASGHLGGDQVYYTEKDRPVRFFLPQLPEDKSYVFYTGDDASSNSDIGGTISLISGQYQFTPNDYDKLTPFKFLFNDRTKGSITVKLWKGDKLIPKMADDSNRIIPVQINRVYHVPFAKSNIPEDQTFKCEIIRSPNTDQDGKNNNTGMFYPVGDGYTYNVKDAIKYIKQTTWEYKLDYGYFGKSDPITVSFEYQNSGNETAINPDLVVEEMLLQSSVASPPPVVNTQQTKAAKKAMESDNNAQVIQALTEALDKMASLDELVTALTTSEKETKAEIQKFQKKTTAALNHLNCKLSGEIACLEAQIDLLNGKRMSWGEWFVRGLGM